MSFGKRDNARASEEMTIPGGPLEVEGDQHGGISVIGGPGASYRVQVCKFAEDAADLAAISAVLSGRTLRVTGSGERSGSFLIIEAPRGSALTVSTSNGPISVAGLEGGSLTASAENGPLAIKDSSASVNGSTENGPITVSGSTGNFKLDAQNGPLTVKLDDEQWNGELEAATKNGPLTVTLPSGFRSGVLIESTGHGPVSCDCDNARKTLLDDEVKRIEFGNGPTVVRLSTVNGPLTVRTR